MNLHLMNKAMPMARISPFRYPGGKAFLYPYLREAVSGMNSKDVSYVEPYAGGAGAALMLLNNSDVDTVHLNDADRCVYSAWKIIFFETDRFIDALNSRPVNMETWWNSKKLVSTAPDKADEFELGFATFFLNRTNRSGILRGSGPIGGYNQLGIWRIDARYYKNTITDRVKSLAKLRDRVFLYNKDGLEFIKLTQKQLNQNTTLYFIDPPYVKAGGRLYLNTMSEKNHQELASFLSTSKLRNWILTYDDCELVRESYQAMGVSTITVPYSLQKKRTESELFIVNLSDSHLTG